MCSNPNKITGSNCNQLGLKWDADVISYYIDHDSFKNTRLEMLNYEWHISNAFEVWNDVSNANIMQATSKQNSMIVIGVGDITGRNSKDSIAQVPVPMYQTSLDDAKLQHDSVGNIIIRKDFYGSEDEFKNALVHEAGHAIGICHLNSVNDVMYPMVQDVKQKKLSKEDLYEVQKRYGVK